MKKLLLPLSLLAACTSKPTYTPAQEKIIKLAQHLEPDSARYVPLRFRKPERFTRTDSVDEVLRADATNLNLLHQRRLDADKLLGQAATTHLPASEVDIRVKQADEASNAVNQALARQAEILKHSSGIVIGERIDHSWRVGEKVDSAEFVVYKSGQVQRLTPVGSSL